MRKNYFVNAFTLVEVLVAVSIFMILMGVTAKLLATLSEMGKKATAIVELHTQAGDILKEFEHDFKNMHLSAAFSYDFENPDQFRILFMNNNKKELGKPSGSYGPYSMAESFANTDFRWCTYTCDYLNGNILYGHTRRPASSSQNVSTRTLDLHNTSKGSNKGITKYHRHATPQLEMKYFFGTGDVTTPSNSWDWDADKSFSPAEKRQLYQGCKFTTGSSFRHSTDPMFRSVKEYKYHLYTHSHVGNTNLLSKDCFAVKNADGLSYNLDYICLYGAPDTNVNTKYPHKEYELYPSQVYNLSNKPNIECPLISFHRPDGTAPTDDDTLGDSDVSVDLYGTGPQLDQYMDAKIKNRPEYVKFSFILHDIPLDEPDYEDVDEDPSTSLLCQALRNKVHVKDSEAMNAASYITEMKQRQQDMLQLIREQGYSVQFFHTAVRLSR